MGAIYNNAMRVVVFLDDGGNVDKDIHPDLRPRQSIMSPAAREALLSMLSHRYFTRLWIIQELVLARSEVFAFHGVEYQADASFSAQGGLAAALRLTEQAKRGDFRDKLFGILGLLGDDHEAVSLGADYTISSLHVLVGIFTHCVFQKGMVDHVLRNAIGKEGWGKQPSWVPAWRTTQPTTLGRRPFIDEYLSPPSPPDVRSNTPFFRRILDQLSNHRLALYLLHMIHFCPISAQFEMVQEVAEKVNGKSLYLYSIRAPNSAILFYAYDRLILNPQTDSILFANKGGPVILGHVGFSRSENDYKLVAPLHSVWATSRRKDRGDNRSIEELIQIQCPDALASSFPLINQDTGSVEDPYLERAFPRFRHLRLSRAADRLRRQVFRRADTSLDTLGILSAVPLPPPITPVIENQRLGEFQGELPKFVEFKFHISQFDEVRRLYLDPLYSSEEDPDGKPAQEEDT
ncbi:hypothetical protein V8F33_003753 [Rhypophila sp. PSN 637]